MGVWVNLRNAAAKSAKATGGALGFDIVRRPPSSPAKPMLDEGNLRNLMGDPYERARPFSMTSVTRMYALHRAVQYLTRAGVDGAIVECGVWRGGSMMLAAGVLAADGDIDREIWMYDTYEGMPPPTDHDRRFDGSSAASLLTDGIDREADLYWGRAPLDATRANMESVGYPMDRIQFVQGKVEDTIPGRCPETAALVRLDTDWYESTVHTLTHLVPRLAHGGVLIIDDYGFWEGARRAVDDFLEGEGRGFLLHRVDSDALIGVKP